MSGFPHPFCLIFPPAFLYEKNLQLLDIYSYSGEAVV